MARQLMLILVLWHIGSTIQIIFIGFNPAVADDLFTISSLSVDTSAQDANEARQLALADGQERALRSLLEKITLDSDHKRIPLVQKAKVGDFVQGFEIANERRSEHRYLADLTVRFKPYAVRTFLQEANIPFSESVSDPIVVLPVFQKNGKNFLWDDPNPWRDTWSDFEWDTGLLDLLVPIGELVDIAGINVRQALKGEQQALENFTSSYGTKNALVVIANLDFDIQERAYLNVTIRQYGNLTNSVRVEKFAADENEDIKALLKRAATGVTKWLEEDWKHQNLLTFDEKRVLTVYFPVGSLDDWLSVGSELSKITVIRAINILILSPREVVAEINYLGSTDRLVSFLAQRRYDLALVAHNWTLTKREDTEDGILNYNDRDGAEPLTERVPINATPVDDLLENMNQDPEKIKIPLDSLAPLDNLLVE